MPNRSNGKVIVWSEGSSTPTRNMSGNLSNPYSLFVTTTGDVYIDSGTSDGRVDKLTLNSTSSVSVMYTSYMCLDLFVDISNTLYCSMTSLHQVVTKSLNSASNAFSIVAGTGTSGPASNMLNNPHGIFVDINFDLYVADWSNHRIQLFRSGELNGTTVAGNGAPGTITLNCPTGIVLDADNNLFIVDSYNHRIVGSGPNGFRCLVGCSGSSGPASNQLRNPWSLSFDSYGNIFVTDMGNSRIQKFVLSTNSCGKYNQNKIVK